MESDEILVRLLVKGRGYELAALLEREDFEVIELEVVSEMRSACDCCGEKILHYCGICRHNVASARCKCLCEEGSEPQLIRLHQEADKEKT